MKTLVTCLALLNLALLASNMTLKGSLKTLQSEMESQMLSMTRRLAQRRQNPAAVQVRRENSANETKTKVHSARTRVTDGDATDDQDDQLERVSLSTMRPDPQDIPLLAEGELSVLYAKRSLMPTVMGVLATRGVAKVDVEAILQDPVWNPEARELNTEERLRLDRWLKDYRYFQEISPLERLKSMRAEIPWMREAGDYLEYPTSGRPPHVEGAKNSFAEPSDTPGMSRLFVFFDDEYPELTHHSRVEPQRALEALVNMYELINGPVQ